MCVMLCMAGLGSLFLCCEGLVRWFHVVRGCCRAGRWSEIGELLHCCSGLVGGTGVVSSCTVVRVLSVVQVL